MSLIELLTVMAIMGVIVALTTASYRSLSDSVEITNGTQQVVDALALARQIATSKNEYVQVRFYAPKTGTDIRLGQYTAVGVFRANAPLYGNANDYKTWETEGRFRKAVATSRIAGNCIVLNHATYSPLFASLTNLGHSGTEKFADGIDYDWVGFYYKPDGSTDLTADAASNSLSLCSLKSFRALNTLPPNYTTLTIDPVIGRCQMIRP
jgi:uncharacterized protein (TIGR02596 family)